MTPPYSVLYMVMTPPYSVLYNVMTPPSSVFTNAFDMGRTLVAMPSMGYATASARSDGMFLLCGGRDSSGMPLADAYGLLMHMNGQWEWTLAPGVSPSPRYEHAAELMFYWKDCRLWIVWLLMAWLGKPCPVGLMRQSLLVLDCMSQEVLLEEDVQLKVNAAVAVLDTAAGAWLDRNGLVTTSRTSKGPTEHDPSLELMRRCRHAAASVAERIYIYGGLKGDILLDEFLVAENSPIQSDINSPILSSERAPTMTRPRTNHSNLSSFDPTSLSDTRPEITSSGGMSMRKNSMEKLVEASAAEAEAASAVWQAMQATSATPEETSMSDDNSQVAETASESSDTDPDVRLHPRAVVIAKEAAGNLGLMVRQLSLDQFENESRRMVPWNNDQSYPTKKITRQRSPQGLHKKASIIISTLLMPRNWKAPANRRFFLDSYEVGELCYAVEQIFMQEPTVLQLKAPIKVFGDLHGQFGDLMRLFDEYGFPSPAGDITYIDYLFLGDYVDRGQHSLETITLLLALKIQYPDNVFLIRGNHEAADINALFGFRLECIERMGESDGIWAWTRFNQLFNFLPLAALIEKKIICMHGGIGRSIHSVEQIEKLERPITMDGGSIILMDLLWSDPTENDSVEGLRPNARGPGLVTFGPDRVTDFCKKNKLQLIIRAHECVMDGFERFAQGQLITLFSATNYCGTANNAGALLVVGRGLVIVPKLIHPLPPPFQSPETSPERVVHDAWMQELNIQRPPTPTRGRPQPELDRNSLAYI
ncbi:hypothetical protein HYC85_013912 [Camellia sinensis]|uniref:Serine/threonine-protein phosphatase n=1 Tax=Camellia sinensis TaxID=4442 RepID=A0A7J7H608_CAMSI|nr:hypothetical protein HYC85_013912 [Camellia sinensis]